MVKVRSRGIKIRTGALIALGGTILTMIVGGIIGGRADALFVALWMIVSASFTANSWPWIIVIVLALALAACIYLWRQNATLMNSQLAALSKQRESLSSAVATKDAKIQALSKERDTLDTLDKVVKLDDSILRLLPNLVSAKDRENEMRGLLKKLLEDNCGTFAGDVDRASLYLPDPKLGNEYLTFWEGYQMPPESIL